LLLLLRTAMCVMNMKRTFCSGYKMIREVQHIWHLLLCFINIEYILMRFPSHADL